MYYYKLDGVASGERFRLFVKGEEMTMNRLIGAIVILCLAGGAVAEEWGCEDIYDKTVGPGETLNIVCDRTVEVYGNLTINGGTVNINSPHFYVLRDGGHIEVNDGELNIVHSSRYTYILLEGMFTVNGGVANINCDRIFVPWPGSIEVNKGTLNAATSEMFTQKGRIQISGGSVTINASGWGFEFGMSSNTFIHGGTTTLNGVWASCKFIKPPVWEIGCGVFKSQEDIGSVCDGLRAQAGHEPINQTFEDGYHVYIGSNCAPDCDTDGVPDEQDNCICDANPAQADADGDGLGDACDCPCIGDVDGDGWKSPADISALVSELLPHATAYYWVPAEPNDCGDTNNDGWLCPIDVSSLISALLPFAGDNYWVQCP